jgi:D-serine dehydratase
VPQTFVIAELDPVLDGRIKGFPDAAGALPLSRIGTQGWRLTAEDLPLPAAVLRTSALDANSAWMAAFLDRTGARLSPHGKTTMSPELFARQLADGAWGLTVADARQMRIARAAGASRIVIGNELVAAQDLAYVARALAADPGLEVYMLADSVAGVRRLAAAMAAAPGRRLNVLLEIGYAQGRSGCRDLAAAMAVARAVHGAAGLALAGVEAFEGLNQSLPAGESGPRVAALLGDVAAAAQAIDAAGLFAHDEVILSAGGSAFFDVVVEQLGRVRLSKPSWVLLRSGCYLSHDIGLYERSYAQLLDRSALARSLPGRFENALEVWAYVTSVPEPGRAILGAGRRDVGADSGLPAPLKHFRPGAAKLQAAPAGWEIVQLNDQHAHMTFPAGDEVAVGDLIGLGASHPCSTFDRWRLIYLVDDGYAVTGAVQTCF